MHYPAAEIEFGSQCSLAIGGLTFSHLNRVPIRNWTSLIANEGDVLRFTERHSVPAATSRSRGLQWGNGWVAAVRI